MQSDIELDLSLNIGEPKLEPLSLAVGAIEHYRPILSNFIITDFDGNYSHDKILACFEGSILYRMSGKFVAESSYIDLQENM